MAICRSENVYFADTLKELESSQVKKNNDVAKTRQMVKFGQSVI